MIPLLVGIGLLLLLGRNSSEGITGYATRKSKWFIPYTVVNGRRKQHVPGHGVGKSGVYFIKEISSGQIVYVGFSQSRLYDIMFRHFRGDYPGKVYSRWQDYKVRVIECAPGQALRAEMYFIRKLQPRDNENKFDDLSESEVKQIEKTAELLAVNEEPTPWD